MTTVETSARADPLAALRSSVPQAEAERTSGKLGQDEFLQLMVTQLKNQDPFKPMESGEFLSQLAQFGTVSGIQDLETSFSQLSTSLVSNQAMQASSLIGRSVLAAIGSGLLEAGGELRGAVDLPASTENVTVQIRNSAGQLLRSLDLGPQPGGMVQFAWDGRDDQGNQVKAGTYLVNAIAGIEGQDEAVESMLYSRVDSVSIDANKQSLTLNLEGAGPLDLSEVRQIM